MKSPRVAVIGTGYLGSIHARLWAKCNYATLSGVYDIIPERSLQLARELGVSWYTTIDQAISDCDAVTIAVPPHSHAEVTLLALNSEKHVLLEKPVAPSLDQALEIQQAAHGAGVIVHVGHIERYNAAFLAAQRYITTPLFIEAHRLSPFRIRGTDVSVINDLMIHDIDLVLSLIRSPIERFEAHGVAVISNSIDIANARIEFTNGCVANLTASRLTPHPLRKLRLFQHSMYLSIDFAKPELEVYRLVEQWTPSMGQIIAPTESFIHARAIAYEHPELPAVNALEEEHRAFIESITNGAPPVVSLENGIAALRLALQIEDRIVQRFATYLQQ